MKAIVTTANREASTTAAKRGGDGTGWRDAGTSRIGNARPSTEMGSWISKARDLPEVQGLVRSRVAACPLMRGLRSSRRWRRHRTEASHGRQVTQVEAARSATEGLRQGTRRRGSEVQASQPEPRPADSGKRQEVASRRRR